MRDHAVPYAINKAERYQQPNVYVTMSMKSLIRADVFSLILLCAINIFINVWGELGAHPCYVYSGPQGA